MCIKQSIKAGSGWLCINTPLKRSLFRDAGTILMLHRVVADDAAAALPHRAALCVGKATFERLLLWLKRHFDCVPLAELLESSEHAGARPRVSLTFDDGWRDNAQHAFPLLEKHGVPASIFLSTDLIGSRRCFWWEAIGETLWGSFGPEARERLAAELHQLGLPAPDDLISEPCEQRRSETLGYYLQSLKALPARQLQALADSCPVPAEPHTLDWQQVADMERSGLIRFGPHGASHAILTGLADDDLHEELRRSHETLGRHCQAPLPVYCYPNGNHDARVREALARQGYRLALGTCSGLHRGRSPAPLAVPRIGVCQHSARRPALLVWRMMQGARQ